MSERGRRGGRFRRQDLGLLPLIIIAGLLISLGIGLMVKVLQPPLIDLAPLP